MIERVDFKKGIRDDDSSLATTSFSSVGEGQSSLSAQSDRDGSVITSTTAIDDMKREQRMRIANQKESKRFSQDYPMIEFPGSIRTNPFIDEIFEEDVDSVDGLMSTGKIGDIYTKGEEEMLKGLLSRGQHELEKKEEYKKKHTEDIEKVIEFVEENKAELMSYDGNEGPPSYQNPYSGSNLRRSKIRSSRGFSIIASDEQSVESQTVSITFEFILFVSWFNPYIWIGK